LVTLPGAAYHAASIHRCLRWFCERFLMLPQRKRGGKAAADYLLARFPEGPAMNSELTLSPRRSKGADRMRLALGLLIVVATAIPSTAQTIPRGRDLGIPFPGQTGPLNAITDVAGVAVGHVTLIEGDGKLVPGKGPIRTGVTAV